MQGVITLWYGNILFQNAALQLLQLVETICEWGRDVYRQGVLNCLAGGRERLREITPAWSRAWSTCSDAEDVLIGNSGSEEGDWEIEGENDVLAQTSSLRGLVLEQPHGHQIVPSRHQMVNDSHGNDASDCDMPDMGENQHRSPGISTQTPPVVVVALEGGWPLNFWTELSLPEELRDMEELLRRIYPETPLQRAAAVLLQLVSDEDKSICTTRLALHRRLGESNEHRVEWRTDAANCTEDDADLLQLPLRAIIVHHSGIEDLPPALVCRTDCMICTQEAAYVLAAIAEAEMPILQWIRYWNSHDCDCLTNAMSMVGRRSARQIVTEILSQRWAVLNLSARTPGNAHLSWESCVGRSELLDFIARVESALRSTDHSPASLSLQTIPQERHERHAVSGLSEAQHELAELRDIPGCLIEAPTKEPQAPPPTWFVPFEDVSYDEVRSCLKTFRIPQFQ